MLTIVFPRHIHPPPHKLGVVPACVEESELRNHRLALLYCSNVSAITTGYDFVEGNKDPTWGTTAKKVSKSESY